MLAHHTGIRDTAIEEQTLEIMALNATKDDADAMVTAVLEKINEECKADGCAFSDSLKTKVEETFGIINFTFDKN